MNGRWSCARFRRGAKQPGKRAAHAGRGTEAAVCYEQTLRITPDDAQALRNWSLARLAAGDLAGGWPEFEYRWACPGFRRRTFSQPRWQGEPLEGRVLLVHAEQGLGDTIQFVRYLPRVAECGGRVILEVPQVLIPLLESSGVGRHAALVATDSALPKFDLQVPLLSLPGVFGTTLESIPAEIPYLAADPRLVERWRTKLAGPALKVGICWQGNTSHPGDYFRSMPLARFAPLAQLDVELISLQRGTGSEQLADVCGSFSVRRAGRRGGSRAWPLHGHRGDRAMPGRRGRRRHGDRPPGRRARAKVWTASLSDRIGAGCTIGPTVPGIRQCGSFASDGWAIGTTCSSRSPRSCVRELPNDGP